MRKRSGTGGLTSQLLLLRAVRLVTSADNARHAASRHRPLHGAHAHFRSRTRARTAAATGLLRPCGQRQRGFPHVVGVGRPFSCHSGRSPLLFRAFLPLSFRAQSRNLSPAGTFQPPPRNALIIICFQNFSWKVPGKNRPPSRLDFYKRLTFNYFRNA